jgi:putative flippase GtrA
LSFTTAFVVAYLIDAEFLKRHHTKYQRWIEGAIQSATTILAGIFVYWWLMGILPVERMREIKLETVLFVSGVIGFTIGFWVPTWFHFAPSGDMEESPERKEKDELQEQNVKDSLMST